MASLDLTSADQAAASGQGGEKVTLNGDFASAVGKFFNVFVGPNGDTNDRPALSGIPGSPHAIPTTTPTSLEFFLPELAPGVYSIYLRRTDLVDDGVLTNALVVTPRQYEGGVFGLRKQLHSSFITGPRNTSQAGAAPVTPDLSPATPVVTGPIADMAETISGTSTNDFATISVFVDAVLTVQTTVIAGVWSVELFPVNTGESITAQASTIGGSSAISDAVVVS